MHERQGVFAWISGLRQLGSNLPKVAGSPAPGGGAGLLAIALSDQAEPNAT